MAANFASDNVGGASPEIVEALARAAVEGPARPYGQDAWTEAVEARLADIFETDLAAFPVATGSAANALALAAVVPPHGAVFCHPESHITTDECGAPEFFTGGAKLIQVGGDHGKLDPARLDAQIVRTGALGIHSVKPAAVSITQASEAGTVYRPAEIEAIAAVARGHGLALHMDGARFANALVAAGVAAGVAAEVTPADLSWRAGVDVLSLGATKNGALAAEAVIFFDRTRAAEFGYRRKRGGHLLSKMRFLSAQLAAYFEDDLWLRNARHANDMTRRLADGLAALPGVRLLHQVEANEIFAELPTGVAPALKDEGFVFYDNEDFGTQVPFVRLVCSFATDPGDVDALIAAAGRHIGAEAIVNSATR